LSISLVLIILILIIIGIVLKMKRSGELLLYDIVVTLLLNVITYTNVAGVKSKQLRFVEFNTDPN
jgi:hypothetical protein